MFKEMISLQVEEEINATNYQLAKKNYQVEKENNINKARENTAKLEAELMEAKTERNMLKRRMRG